MQVTVEFSTQVAKCCQKFSLGTMFSLYRVCRVQDAARYAQSDRMQRYVEIHVTDGDP